MQRVVLVERGLTDILSADAVRAAYAAAKLLDPAPSHTSRVTLCISAGTYDFVTTPLVLDADYIDLLGMGATEDDTVFTSQISVASHGTVEQTAQDVQFFNLTIDIDSSYALEPQLTGDATDPAAYFPDSFPLVTGDTYRTISNANEITDVAAAYKTGDNIYASIIDNTGSWKIEFYKEDTRTTLIGHTADFTANGEQFIVADGGSGLGGFIRIVNYTDVVCAGEETNRGLGPIAANTGITIRISGRTRMEHVKFTTQDAGEIDLEAGTTKAVGAWPTRPGVFYSGTYIYCIGGDFSFGGAFNGNCGSEGTFVHCSARHAGFGGWEQGTGTGPATIVNGTYVYCTGQKRCFEGFSNGTFWYCTATDQGFGGLFQGASFFCTVTGISGFGGEQGHLGYSQDCTAGGGSYGDDVSRGVSVRCISGAGSDQTLSGTFDGSWGGTASAGGESFTGTCYECIGGRLVWGCAGVVSTGSLIRCKVGNVVDGVLTLGVYDNSAAVRGGLIDSCYFKSLNNASTRHAMTVGTGAIVRNCTLIATHVSAKSINATSAGTTINANYNRMNRAMSVNIDNTAGLALATDAAGNIITASLTETDTYLVESVPALTPSLGELTFIADRVQAAITAQYALDLVELSGGTSGIFRVSA